MDKLLYPFFKVNIGNYVMNSGLKFDVYSAKDSYFDWAKITLSDKLLEALKINQMDNVNIKIGYDETSWDVFSGSVERNLKKDLTCKDNMLKLKQCKLTETFLNTDPMEIIRFGVTRAGITSINIQEKTFPKRPKFSVANKSVLEMITQVHQLWDIDEKFYCSTDGAFNWGITTESSKVYSFKYGENVISLELINKTWHLTTVAAPFIKHSSTITIEHPKINGSYEVLSVHHFVNDEGYLRTEICFVEVA